MHSIYNTMGAFLESKWNILHAWLRRWNKFEYLL